jgi:rod shape-determining protein MreD
MRGLATLFVGFVLLLVQSVLLQLVPVQVPTPAFGVLVALHVGLSPRWTFSSAVFAGFSLGYLFDLVSGTPRGTHTFVYSVLALLASAVGPRVSVRGFFLRASAGFVVTFVGGLLVGGVRAVCESASTAPGFRIILLEAALTGLVGPLVLGLLDRLDRRLDAAGGEAGMVARGSRSRGGLELP